MEEEFGETVAEEAGEKGRKPQFTVRQIGAEGYVGSAWIAKSKYGDRCISITVNADVPKGARLYVNPTKACAGIIG